MENSYCLSASISRHWTLGWPEMSFKSHIRHFGTTSVCKMAELCSSTRRHIKEWRNKVKSIDERELDTCFDYDLQQLHSLIYFYFKVYFGFCLETSVIPLMLLEGSHPKRNNITISNSSAALSFMEDSVLFFIWQFWFHRLQFVFVQSEAFYQHNTQIFPATKLWERLHNTCPAPNGRSRKFMD